MTKRDYIKFAAMIRSARTGTKRDGFVVGSNLHIGTLLFVQAQIMQILSNDNGSFNALTFVNACQPNED